MLVGVAPCSRFLYKKYKTMNEKDKIIEELKHEIEELKSKCITLNTELVKVTKQLQAYRLTSLLLLEEAKRAKERT